MFFVCQFNLVKTFMRGLFFHTYSISKFIEMPSSFLFMCISRNKLHFLSHEKKHLRSYNQIKLKTKLDTVSSSLLTLHFSIYMQTRIQSFLLFCYWLNYFTQNGMISESETIVSNSYRFICYVFLCYYQLLLLPLMRPNYINMHWFYSHIHQLINLSLA